MARMRNPNALYRMTLKELKEVAKILGLKGCSSKNKDELYSILVKEVKKSGIENLGVGMTKPAFLLILKETPMAKAVKKPPRSKKTYSRPLEKLKVVELKSLATSLDIKPLPSKKADLIQAICS